MYFRRFSVIHKKNLCIKVKLKPFRVLFFRKPHSYTKKNCMKFIHKKIFVYEDFRIEFRLSHTRCDNTKRQPEFNRSLAIMICIYNIILKMLISWFSRLSCSPSRTNRVECDQPGFFSNRDQPGQLRLG